MIPTFLIPILLRYVFLDVHKFRIVYIYTYMSYILFLLQFVMETRVRKVNEICGSADQRNQRALLIRSRAFSETKVYLNNSNTKWLTVGVTPNSREKAGSIKNFYTELYIGGSNCQTLPLGGITGFKRLVRQLREIGYWQNMYLDVSNKINLNCSITVLISFSIF